MPAIRIRIAANFERNLDAIRDFVGERDSPGRFADLLDEIFDRLIPNLKRFSRMGVDLLARQPRSVEGTALHEQVQALLGGDGELRQYVMGDYVVLYAMRQHALDLLAIKHHRQLSFDFDTA